MTIPPKMNALNSNRSLSESSNKVEFSQNSTSTFSSPSSSYLDLPLDPKSWTPTQVATYLTYSLQLYPPETVSDLSRYVQNDLMLTGRRFLRLKEEHLKQFGFNESWTKLIMSSVKALRREQLREKILLKGYGIVEESEELGCEEFDMIDANEDCSSKISPALNSSSNIMPNNVTFSDLVAYDKELIRHELFKRDVIKLESDKKMDTSESFSISLSFSRVLSNALEWAKKLFGRTTYINGFAQGTVFGGIIVLAYMRAIR
ncbi:2918_t:CDS:2 [Dentiscutata erythropus]|uniref:2918_t:CDS:1 n=1 Tax=Dentiscutata erythropus TaxID=1348616 RepID=A0A9N9FVB4_9GLOM|nr:2918_t:CDS:2 [Dentiscutata erythropus]